MDRNNFTAVPQDLWELVEPLLPRDPPRPKGGRKRVPARRILGGVVYRLRTGCQWQAIPRQFAPGPTVHRRFQEWVKAGAFERVFEQLVRLYDDVRGVDWKWASMDTAMVKAPKGGTSPARTRRTAPSSV